MSRPLVIAGGCVLDAPAHQAVPGDLRIRGGRIEAVGVPGSLGTEDVETIDATGFLLVPGFVNAHTHGHGSLGKGTGDRWTLELLLNAGPWISGKRTLDDKRLAAKLNAAEMLRKGCTTAYDMYYEFPVPSVDGLAAAAEAYIEVGMRVVLTPQIADLSLYEAIPGLLDHLPDGLRREAEKFRLRPLEECIGAVRGLLESWPHDRDKARPAIGPTIPIHCTDPFLAACRDLARDFDVGVQVHLAESKVQAVNGLRRWGRSIVSELDRIGLLGPGFTGAHSVWLDSEDIARLAGRGANVAHNPGSNLMLGSGIAPVREMRRQGLNVGIGTDGSNSSDHQNCFEAMRLAAFVQRITSFDPTDWMPAEEIVHMATEGGARAAGFEGRLGRLEPGYLADVVFLDLDGFGFVPLNDPTNQIVLSEDGTAVHSVMVAGQFAYRNRAFLRFDEASLKAEVAKTLERLKQDTAEDRLLAERLEAHMRATCLGLARSPYHVHRTCAWH